MEVFGDGLIRFVGLLDHHADFYVPETGGAVTRRQDWGRVSREREDRNVSGREEVGQSGLPLARPMTGASLAALCATVFGCVGNQTRKSELIVSRKPEWY